MTGRCEVCDRPLPAEGLSPWFCDQYCQKQWYVARTTDPGGILRMSMWFEASA